MAGTAACDKRLHYTDEVAKPVSRIEGHLESANTHLKLERKHASEYVSRMLSARVESISEHCHRNTARRGILMFGMMHAMLLGTLSEVSSPTIAMAVSPSDPFISAQPSNVYRNLGETATFRVTANGTVPLQYQWQKNGTDIPQANGFALMLTNLGASDAGNYSVAVINGLGNAVTSAPALLVVNSALLDTGFRQSFPDRGSTFAMQSDGRILFTYTVFGFPATNYLSRLNPDGTVDSGFHIPANHVFNCALLQTDGKTVLGGHFTNIAGQTRHRLAHLDPTGTLDGGFHIGAYGANSESFLFPPGITLLSEQADGKILVGGIFTNLGGLPRTNFARLLANGTADSSFSVPMQGEPFCVASQADGKFIVGGNFVLSQLPARTNLARFHANGTLDASFDPGAIAGTVSALAVQADGRIILGRTPSNTGFSRNLVTRLNTDGTPDISFNPDIAGLEQHYKVRCIALQCDGGIIVGGTFDRAGGEWHTNLVRLFPDGSLDRRFTPEVGPPGSSVNALQVQDDGKIIVAGGFTILAGQSCGFFGRLLNPDPATQSLSYDGSSITWLRGGSSPEVWRTTFEYSSTGGTWSDLGPGARIPGGWRLAGVSIPLGGTIRARGHLNDSRGKSSWFVETLTKLPPVILSKDSEFGIVSNRFGFPLLGWSGRELVVEDSTDMVNWNPVITNIAGTAPLFFFVTNWHQAPHRFYRARTQ